LKGRSWQGSWRSERHAVKQGAYQRFIWEFEGSQEKPPGLLGVRTEIFQLLEQWLFEREGRPRGGREER